MTIPTKSIDLDTISELLAGEKKREDERYVRRGEERLRYVHGYSKKFDYLFDLPVECMFKPFQSKLVSLDEGYQRCIPCGAIVRDPESHYNWHKRELT